VLTTAWATLGEELGWRGLLVPELARRFSFTATALISGVAWAAWHVPVMVLADYHNPGAPLWFGLVCFAVLVIGISFAFAWLRLKSGSVWPTVLLHASHNVASRPSSRRSPARPRARPTSSMSSASAWRWPACWSAGCSCERVRPCRPPPACTAEPTPNPPR
jgi:membrane protease YdiL (CAAX protease family)